MEQEDLTASVESGGGGNPVGGHGAGRGRFRRTATGVALAASMAVGGLAVAAVNPLGSAGAGTTTTVASGQSAGDGAGQADAARSGKVDRRAKVVDTALDSLVADGTLTQAQADAVATRLADTARLIHGERHERRVERRKAMAATAADALGISTEDLVARLRDGATVAEIAAERDVDVQKVIDALESEARSAIDEAVADGRVPADRADELAQRANERIERFVNEGPKHPRGGS